jgi:hypothetical protein
LKLLQAANEYLVDYIKTHNDKFADSTNYTLNAFKSAKDFDLNYDLHAIMSQFTSNYVTLAKIN